MIRFIRARATYANVMATMALFFSLSGVGMATHLVVKSSDIKDNQVKSADVRNDDLKGGGLTGKDIKESTLARVPSALLGGMGRSSDPYAGDTCTPGGSYLNCANVELTLTAPARVLIIGTITAEYLGDDVVRGFCRLGRSQSGAVAGTEVQVNVQDADEFEDTEPVPLVGVTEVLPKGTYLFGVDCVAHTRFFDARVTAVALSSG